jgi:hypothetical protein
MTPPLLARLMAPEYAGSRAAILPFALLLVGAAWMGGFGWWSLLAPVAFAAVLVAAGALARLAARLLDRDVPFARTLTPLDRPDPAPAGANADAVLAEAEAAAPGAAPPRLFLPAYGKSVPLRLDLDQEEGPPGLWPETAAAVRAVAAWTEADRTAVRRLLLDDARAVCAEQGEPCAFTLQTIEAEVSPLGLDFVQWTPARAGLGLFRLLPSWEPEHGVAVVLEAGRPVRLINGLKEEPNEVFWE